MAVSSNERQKTIIRSQGTSEGEPSDNRRVMQPRVSILMLTFNRPQFLSRAIESIRSQTFTDWELLIVHDGPNEEIAEILHDWEGREPRLRYFRRLTPGNIAQANNFGLARARGEYIAILDDDDYWRVPDKLERQVRFLDEHAGCVACGGGAVCIDLEGRETLRYLRPEQHSGIVRNALIANPMVHSTAMYRREAAERVGFYDESLPGFQDWDLFLKLARHGQLYNFQDHFLAYQIWDGGGSFHAQRANTWSSVQIVRRHGPYYSGYPLAVLMARCYFLYARLPLWFRKMTFSTLTHAKKALFSPKSSG
jgi:glycosyltransferase involved in cell wall biosynthesis